MTIDNFARIMACRAALPTAGQSPGVLVVVAGSAQRNSREANSQVSTMCAGNTTTSGKPAITAAKYSHCGTQVCGYY
jgi:hypothetical protein